MNLSSKKSSLTPFLKWDSKNWPLRITKKDHALIFSQYLPISADELGF
jgi:hypothetical protein